MEKLFTFAGKSTLNGVVAYRFANDAGRVRVLERCGHTDIDLRRLPCAMTKADATLWCVAQGIHAEQTRVARTETRTVAVAKTQVASVKARAEVDVVDDDGFVEPKDEAIQVAMCRLARQKPQLSARQLYLQVV